MKTESDIGALIRNMQPRLQEQPCVFCKLSDEAWPSLLVTPIGLFREDEGWSAILEEAEAKTEGLAYEGIWAHIVLEVYSDLKAIGFLAKISSALAEKGIPVNPVSAFHHDHLFVPWQMCELAMRTLMELTRSQ